MMLRTLRRLWLAAVLISAPGFAGIAQAQSDGPIRDAFLAFYPMYEMARLRHVAVDEPANPARGPVNRFLHVRRLLDHTARTVTGPNNDTLYSSARLDLSRGPVLVATPAILQRYYSLQFMNMYTDNVAILGRRDGGDGPLRVAVVGPQWKGELPAHTHLVRSDTNDMWLLVRTLVDGPADLVAVGALQQAMSIDAPQGDYPVPRVRPVRNPGPAEFIPVISEFLARNPPQGAMKARADAAAAVGIQAGAAAAWTGLPAELKARWEAAWPALMAELRQPAHVSVRRIGGWSFPPRVEGDWSGNMLLRASVALRGIAALDTLEALYLSTFADADGAALDGRARYLVRIPAGGLPVWGFWSMTLYEETPDGRFFLTDNPIRRYSIGDRTAGLRSNPDGSFDVLVQAEAPADAANWLPAPRGPFRLTLRAYLPKPELVAGESALPRVERASP
ncbi:MAG TPA: DUF1254 domain-containing protein [Burkholderiaceae bacterium]|nr:DUF1254 domain-containing protein [Burkholderiaceae bacterium]